MWRWPTGARSTSVRVAPGDAQLIEAFHGPAVAREHLLPLLQPHADRCRRASSTASPRVDELDHLSFVALLGGEIIGMAELRRVAGQQRGRGGVHHRRRAPRPGHRDTAARVAGGRGPRGRPQRIDRAGPTQQPAHGRGVPPGRVRSGERVRRRRDRGATRSRADLAERGEDRGTGPTIRGPFGRAAALPVLGGGDRRRTRPRRARQPGVPQPSGPRIPGARVPGQPTGRIGRRRGRLFRRWPTCPTRSIWPSSPCRRVPCWRSSRSAAASGYTDSW